MFEERICGECGLTHKAGYTFCIHKPDPTNDEIYEAFLNGTVLAMMYFGPPMDQGFLLTARSSAAEGQYGSH